MLFTVDSSSCSPAGLGVPGGVLRGLLSAEGIPVLPAATGIEYGSLLLPSISVGGGGARGRGGARGGGGGG